MMGRWDHIPPLSDDEEAELQRKIAEDPDDYDTTDEELARARPFAEVFPELLANMQKAARGRPKLDNPKQKVTLRLSADVLEHYRQTGPGWQTRIDEALQKTLKRRKAS